MPHLVAVAYLPGFVDPQLVHRINLAQDRATSKVSLSWAERADGQYMGSSIAFELRRFYEWYGARFLFL